MNGLALCAGIGGLELGLKLVLGDSYRTICYVEREAYPAACLVKRMEEGYLDKAPIWDDVKTFNPEPWCGKVDIISGGYPCQPFSKANRYKKGEKDPRHLWPYINEIIKAIKPTICFFENVRNHLNCGGEIVWTDLQTLGYKVEGGIFSASEIGAPHIRERLFILSYLNGHTLHIKHRRTGWKGRESPIQPPTNGKEILGWGTEPPVGRVANGIPYRMERLRALGNAVVPVVAAKAFVSLLRNI
jgi:DNA (cytosine-5)-methyltransferase 1